MTIREKILLQIETDLVNLQSQYGYQMNYPNTVKGLVAVNEDTRLPMISYDLGDEALEPITSSYGADQCQCELFFNVIVNDFIEKGKIIDIREQAIGDMKKFIYGSTMITTGKSLNLIEVEGILYWHISTVKRGETNLQDGVASIDFLVMIIYNDFRNETANLQNVNA